MAQPINLPELLQFWVDLCDEVTKRRKFASLKLGSSKTKELQRNSISFFQIFI